MNKTLIRTPDLIAPTIVGTPNVQALTQHVQTGIKRRIGIFPGMFNPIHNAHLAIAEQVKTQLGLDYIGFMPNLLPKHKVDNKLLISNQDRLNLIQLAIHTNPAFYLETAGLKTKCQYTYNVIKWLSKRHRHNEYYLIIGGDMIAYLPKWSHIDDLMRMVHVVGVKRAGFPITSPYPIIWIDVPYLDISSTTLRQDLHQGRSIRYFVPELCWDYIMQKHLYQR